jgi:hypothetical protein
VKGKKHKRNRTYDSSSSDSNSKKEIKSHDTELVVDKRLKLDKPFTSDLQSTQPRPINSLTAIDGHDRQYFNELCSTVVSRRIFIRSQSLIAR